MTAVSAPRPGWELLAGQVNQRRYEALRAYLYEGASLAQAAGAPATPAPRWRPGPRPAGRQAHRVRPARHPRPQERPEEGRRPRPGHRAAPRRPVGLRDQHPAHRGRDPLGRTAVSDILREEGFGRLLRGPAPEASTSPATSGRDTRLPAAAVTDFAALPARVHTTMAGLLLAIPDLVALDLPALAAAAGYPGSKAIPATGYLLALLALKLTATRRVSPRR